MKARAGAAFVFAAATACAALASAQPRRPAPLPVPSAAPAATMPTNVRAHVGTDYAARLLRSTDPDERIRGIQRAATIGSAETVALLVQATESSPAVRSDSRALIELARGLARFADQERARVALLLIVNAGNPGIAGRLPQPGRSGDALSLEEGDPVARTELARQIAAIALARSGTDRALEQLYGVARSGASGQSAAMLALTLQPPRDPGFYGTTGASMPASVVRMLGQLGDLRALELLHTATRSTDVTVRGAALVSLAELGDERAVALSRAAIAESDARLRAAAGEAFVLLAAGERFKAVAALIADEATAAIGVRLAERVYNAEITKLLAVRVIDHPDRELRAAAIRALGRSPEPAAAVALTAPALLADPQLGYFAALALARSPAPNAMQLVTALASAKATAGLGVRAYVVRAAVRGERSGAADDLLARLMASKEGRERALGAFGRVALGLTSATSLLDDPDPRVRRSVAMASLAKPTKATLHALLEHAARERDDATRQVLAIGLLGGDPEGLLTTTSLLDRAESGGADAALSATALTRRAEEANERKVGQLLASKDPVLRAHAARGLAFATLPDASGRLATAYAYETDATVRRAVVGALAARLQDATAPARRATLETAAALDPDGPTRQAARLGLSGSPSPLGPALATEAAWLRITLDGGAAPGEVFVGSLVRSDGVAVPIAFDDDGYAIAPGVPPGEARLVLAPRLPSYKAPSP
ncbi:MAG TPA: HEAT repeat domain-containing protein [Labilithrix sp.]|nr:HEAT repeat domain-containing protein [Labilithrix sp.]